MKQIASVSAEHLLQRLSHLIDQLACKINEHPNKSAECLFSPGLFRGISHNLNDYLTEISSNYLVIKRMVEKEQNINISFVSDRLIEQIAALMREIATRPYQQAKKRVSKSGKEDIYQKLARHQDYQRRLQDMIRDKKLELSKQSYQQEKIRLQQEIASFDNRLARCQHAIKQIERQIEHYEN